jgi:hypothetical protein
MLTPAFNIGLLELDERVPKGFLWELFLFAFGNLVSLSLSCMCIFLPHGPGDLLGIRGHCSRRPDRRVRTSYFSLCLSIPVSLV